MKSVRYVENGFKIRGVVVLKWRALKIRLGQRFRKWWYKRMEPVAEYLKKKEREKLARWEDIDEEKIDRWVVDFILKRAVSATVAGPRKDVYSVVIVDAGFINDEEAGLWDFEFVNRRFGHPLSHERPKKYAYAFAKQAWPVERQEKVMGLVRERKGIEVREYEEKGKYGKDIVRGYVKTFDVGYEE